ncbi:hypothetical protein Droror1_Dr00005634 [Drosera rotundifolia]
MIGRFWGREMEEDTSRVLVIGATGNLGYHIAVASIRSSHPTFALVRDDFTAAARSVKIQTLADAGVQLLKGSLDDEESLVEAVNQVNVVICAIPSRYVLHQKPLIRVIKRAGHIKRFIPSEFGMDPDKVQISGMDYGFYAKKTEIRRLVEAEGIPYTFVSCNFLMSYLLPSIVQPGLAAPPRDKVTVFGDGNVKGVFMNEVDVAAYTIKAVDDPRTLNKVMYLRPPGNFYTMNELINLWETKIGKKLDKDYVKEEELLKKIEETPYPENMELIFIYSAFVKADQTYFDIEPSGGVEGSLLYPHIGYTTISEYLDTLV